MSPTRVLIAGAALAGAGIAGAGIAVAAAACVEIAIQYRKARRWTK